MGTLFHVVQALQQMKRILLLSFIEIYQVLVMNRTLNIDINQGK